VPLLVGTDGVEKMGKSLNNYIAINDTADEQFGKVMSIPDSVVGMYARLCTTLDPRDVDEIEKDVASGGPAANAAKRRVAREIVALYHDAAAATAAETRFDTQFGRDGSIDDAPAFVLAPESPVHLPALMVAAGLAASSSEARRSIDGGAVRLAGERLPARAYDVDRAELVDAVLAVGKRRAVRLVEG
jgi:tyrosyl-tRNA synthetase